uniref:Glycoprotein hormone subunit beta domain-containing protein n=1 Tax=Varanus komodoensis TaxID=61221 RepID=A0A8D2ITQ8_VARKO
MTLHPLAKTPEKGSTLIFLLCNWKTILNATIAAEKEDCPVCMAITTSICSGYCETRVQIYPPEQRVCTYKDVRYETMLLRGCPAGVDPSFTYPVALSCHCDLCKMDSSDCTVQSTGPNSCSNQHVLAS